jgi:RNA polymerase sigma factor (sigma-70 family)
VTNHRGLTTALSVFVRACRTPDLRKKLLFSGAMIRGNLAPPAGIKDVVRGIRAIASGARASRDAEFTGFVQAASPSLLRAALVLLDSREDAEDVLQVTMLRTYRRWEQARQAPQAYARAVLVNACRERWRHRGRHPEISQDVDVLAGVDTLSNVVSFAEAVDRRHVLVRVLRQLPGIQREVLVCRYLLDATVAETAAALGIAEGTVKSAASRGLGQLRQLLHDEEKRGHRVHPR